jgi:hypothetical protein
MRDAGQVSEFRYGEEGGSQVKQAGAQGSHEGSPIPTRHPSTSSPGFGEAASSKPMGKPTETVGWNAEQLQQRSPVAENVAVTGGLEQPCWGKFVAGLRAVYGNSTGVIPRTVGACRVKGSRTG